MAIPHLVAPLQVVGGRFLAVEQDTDEEVAVCVRNICAFEQGYRHEDPDFGIPDPTFRVMPIDTNAIAQALADYEDRAQVNITQELTPDGAVTLRLEVDVPASEESEDM